MGFIDSSIPYAISSSFEQARSEAAAEAVNTGGVIFEVSSIAAEVESLVLVGRLPPGFPLARAGSGSGRPQIRPAGIGRLHLAWASLLEPEAFVGLLVLRPPIALQGSVGPRERPRLALSVARSASSVASHALGPICCVDCNDPLSEERLASDPLTRTCADCEERRVLPRKAGAARQRY